MTPKRLRTFTLILMLVMLPACLRGDNAATVASLTKKLWPAQRIDAAIRAVEKQKAEGLLSEVACERKLAMLSRRKAGTYKPESLTAENPPLNFIQNGGFEKVNRNSRPDRSRWLWWGGWSWGGDYENMWESDAKNVHSGKFSARIRCTGSKGRIGISTAKIPLVPGATEYTLTFWAKGDGENMLFVNYEGGVSGTMREKIAGDWKQYTLTGKPAGGAQKTFTVYFYHIGTGTIWLDDVELVPVGGTLDE